MLYHRLSGRRRRWVSAGLLAALLLIWASGREAPPRPVEIAPRPTTRPAVFPLSLTPTPRSWDQRGFLEAFATAEKLVPTICLPDPVDWWKAAGRSAEDSKPFRDGRWQRVLLDRHRLGVFVQMDPYPTRRGDIPGLPRQVARPTFAEPILREAFVADALQRLEIYRPRFICLAMEINAYHEQRPADFDHFIALFRQAREAIKRRDPDVMVFVSFQYEQLLGLFGGQAGLPRHGPDWELIGRFGEDLDAVGISSYPMRSLSPPRFGDPAELPADYYRRIARHTRKPVVFAELGWASDPAFGGSPEHQAAFIRRLPELLGGLDVRLVNYNFLFDARGFGEVFESMGLIGADGKVRPALAEWQGLQAGETAHPPGPAGG